MSDPFSQDELDRINEAVQQKIELIKQTNIYKEQLKNVNNQHEKQILNLNVEKQAFQEILQMEIDRVKASAQGGRLNQQQIETIQHLKREQSRLNGVLNQTVELERQRLEALKESEAAAEQVVKQIAVATLGMKKFEDTFLGTLSKADFASLSKKMGEYFTLQNIGYTAIEKVAFETFNLAREQESAITAFKIATAAGDKYNDLLISSQMQLRTFGVSMEDTADAVADLYENTSLFTEMSERSKKVLVENVALLDKFGVDGAKDIEFLTKALGMNADQAAMVTRDLVGMSRAIGLPAKTVMREFGPAMSKLAAHGEDSIKIFKGMAAAAKATGVEINTLIGLAGQFDTFEDAAQSVGKLNAILGGPYLNSIEMIKASEEDRIRMLIESINLSGRSFEDLSRYERKAVASAAGITNMAEANKIFNTSLEAYDIAQFKAQQAKMSQEEFKEATRGLMSLFEKLKQIAANFAVSMRPVIDVFIQAADAILEFQENMGESFGMTVLIGGAILMLVGSFTAIIGSVLAFGLALAGTLVSMFTFGLFAPKIGKGLSAISTGMLKVSASAIGLGAATLLFGAGIGLAATGLAAFVSSFSLLDKDQLIAVKEILYDFAIAVGVLTVGMIAAVAVLAIFSGLAPKLAIGVAIVFGLALAFAAVATSVALAAAGISLIGFSVGFLVKELNKEKAIENLNQLGVTLGTMALKSLYIVPGIIAITAAVARLGVALKKMIDDVGLEQMQTLVDLLENIDKFSGGSVSVASPKGGATPSSPFTNMASAVSGLTKEKVDQAERLVGVAKTFNISNNNFSATQSDNFKNSLGPLATAKEVSLEIDGDQFARIVAPYIGKRLNIKARMK